MGVNNRLSAAERERIAELRRAGKTTMAIAREVGRCEATVRKVASKLTDAELAAISQMARAGMGPTQVAKALGRSVGTVWGQMRRAWLDRSAQTNSGDD